jgi:hypothetical protein
MAYSGSTFWNTLTLNLSHFVAHKTWQSHGVALHCLRAHRVQRGEPFRGRPVLVYTRFSLLQTARN